jgi:TP901 family phage tail tape measure protein/lambda family phage tail tape measure protein
MSLDITTLSIEVKSVGIKDASNALSGLSTSANNVEKRVSAIVIAMEKLDAVTKLAAVSAGGYNTQLMMQMNTMSALRVDTSATVTATNNLAATMSKLSASLITVAEKSTSASSNQRSHTTSMKEAHDVARGLAGSLGMLWMTYGNIAQMGVGLALGATLKGVVSVGKDVEATLEGIRVKGMESVESIDKMRVVIAELGTGLYGPKEVAKALETMVLAGLDAKQAIGGVADALNLATVGGTTIEKSAYTLVQVGTSLGYTSDNFGRVADVIAMTAAVSMSSVESLSEAFKSASSVGKLYGVTLVDIGTSLAALSNLGIQGSAAGTSLKNFYKELASGADRVKGTLKDMQLVPSDFKDAEGRFLGVLQVVEKLAIGMDNLKQSQVPLAMQNLSNERGMKTAMELYSLYKQKVDDTTESGVQHMNMLSMLREKILDSYGFAAIGAAQMSLTVDAQFKSVANTIQTVFLAAFQKVSPEISAVASSLKDLVNSAKFSEDIQKIAVAFSKLALVVAENIPLIIKLVELFLGMRAAIFIVEFFGAVAIALRAVAVSAAAASIPLGAIAIALLAAGAAYVYFKTKRDESNTSDTQKTAIKYSQDFAKSLEDEAKRMTDKLNLMKQTKNAIVAETESMQNQQLELAKLQGEKAKSEAGDRLLKARKNVSDIDIEISAGIVKRGGRETSAVREYRLAQENKLIVDRQITSSNLSMAASMDVIRNKAKEIEDIRIKKEAADRKAIETTGRGMLSTGDVKKSEAEKQFEKDKSSMDSLMTSINERIALDQEQLDSTTKLTNAQKLIVLTEERLNELNKDMSPLSKARLKDEADLLQNRIAYLKYVVPMSASHDADLKVAKERSEVLKTQLTHYTKEAEKQENLVATYGKTKAAIEEAAIARDRMAWSIKSASIDELEAEGNILDMRERANKASSEYERRSGKGAGKTMEEAGTDALRKYQEEAMNTGKAIEDSLTSAFKNAEDALVNFVKTGKLDFSTLADSIISDIIRMNVKSMLGGGGSTGGFSNGAGLLSSLAGMFGGTSVASSGAGMIAPFVTNVAGAFADGGDPPVGKPSLVGERGPEIFVPKAAGTIVPNEMIGGGGGTQVTYAPVIHIDSRTDRAEVAQLVQKAVQSGNAQLMDKLQRSGINR